MNHDIFTKTLASQFRQSQTKLYLKQPSNRVLQNNDSLISRAQRFQFSSADNPGPGSYQFINNEHKRSIRLQSERTEFLEYKQIAKQHQWLVCKGRIPYQIQNSWNKIVGPGKYDSNEPTRSSHSNWGKNNRFNYDKMEEKVSIGPGYYDKDGKEKKRTKTMPNSIFKSKSPKTFIQLIKKHEQTKALGLKVKVIKSQEQLIEQQSLQSQNPQITATNLTKKETSHNSPQFKSKIIRFYNKNDKSQVHIGPGSYLSTQNSTNKELVKQRVASNIHYQNKSHLKSQNNRHSSNPIIPRLGSYEIHKNKEVFLKKAPFGVILKQQRFKYLELKSHQMPGPGEYMKNRYVMIKEQNYNLKEIHKSTNKLAKGYDFGHALRSTITNHSQVPFGQYQTNLYDIAHRLEKDREHLNKLKILQVSLPAFNKKT